MSNIFPAPAGSGWMRRSMRTKFHLFGDDGVCLCNKWLTLYPEDIQRRYPSFAVGTPPTKREWWAVICVRCCRLSDRFRASEGLP